MYKIFFKVTIYYSTLTLLLLDVTCCFPRYAKEKGNKHRSTEMGASSNALLQKEQRDSASNSESQPRIHVDKSTSRTHCNKTIADETSRIFCYEEGDEFRFTCEVVNTNTNYSLVWHQEKGNITIGSVSIKGSRKLQLSITLERFDHSSKLFCQADYTSYKYKSSDYFTFLLSKKSRLKDEYNPAIMYFNENKTLDDTCDTTIDSIYIDYYNGHPYQNVSQNIKIANNGSDTFCLSYNQTRDNGVIKITRYVYNRKIYIYRNDSHSGTILNELKTSSSWSIDVSIPLVSALVTVVVLIIMGVIICVRFKRRRLGASAVPREEACSNEVTYTELEFIQSSSNKKVTYSNNDESPYAEIIGVLAPKKMK